MRALFRHLGVMILITSVILILFSIFLVNVHYDVFYEAIKMISVGTFGLLISFIMVESSYN